MHPPIEEILQVAIEAAYVAGKITLEYFQTTSYDVETKEDLSPVTIADRRAEESIRSAIRRRFPDHSILGEEAGESVGAGGVRWIIDPIDGTKSFIHGVPLYGVMIGVEIDGDVQVGVVNLPPLGEMHYASRGNGAYCNGRRSRVSSVASLSDATLLTTSHAGHRKRDEWRAEGYDRLERSVKLERSWGDCYAYMLVATGRAEIAVDPKMSVWDCAAVKPIIEEAGGRFTDWRGDATIRGGDAIATNGLLHEESLRILCATRPETTTIEREPQR